MLFQYFFSNVFSTATAAIKTFTNPTKNNNGALMLECSGVSTADPGPLVQTPEHSVQHAAGGNTANALYSATEETDLQDSGK